MSFNGKIEDLPILDIFQYLHAGCKSGTLILSRDHDTAYIYFQKGNIVHAISPQRVHIGDLLIESKDITLKTLQNALVMQTREHPSKPVGQILVEMGAIPAERLKEMVLRQIEQVIYHLVTWMEGDFAFRPNEMIPVDDINLNPTAILPTSNVNTQLILMEAVRILDERRKAEPAGFDAAATKKTAAPASPSPKPVPAAPEGRAVAGTEHPSGEAVESRWGAGKGAPLLLLSDDGIFKNLLRVMLQDEGLDVVVPTTVEDCAAKCIRHIQNGTAPVILVEDVSASPGRRNRSPARLILGERERAGWPSPVVVLSVEMKPDTIWELYQAGARMVLPRPIRSENRDERYTEQIRNFGNVVIKTVRGLQEDLVSLQARQQNYGQEFLKTKQALYRIAKETRQAQIPREILKIVAESMNRAVLFWVRGEELIGLSSFGSAMDGRPIESLLRTMRVSLGSAPLLRRCVAEMTPHRGPVDSGAISEDLAKMLGLPASGLGMVLPLVSMGQTVALLYSDQGPNSKPLSGGEILEVVAGQAGLALENVRLRER